ncbi:NPCBM-associated, NEW3 domain of alpha-galactosidase [Halolamina pelagica]|uniref:NPCBM-associated, NEW3 domain of alpha-galactosidase n=1 Tax=Halolamina pelagica TaxID=699431 RepID=A0A0P7GTH6_9EURY|nr:hypothetical protein [Halolamina pelagica]KPN32277.1 NPCBM-associated, NEW3 domain of alpha-galactosidase [Halolamina pelagica]
MKRIILVAFLVALAAVPVATAVAPTDGGTQAAAPAPNEAVSTTTATGSDSDSAADSEDTQQNYTRLYVDARESYLDLKPGESDTFTVVVENGEDEAVDVNPHLFTSPTDRNPIESSWVEIDGPDSIDAGEEVEYEVRVAVPEDAEIARYSGMIAFTDETVASAPNRPARPVHAAHTSVEVWKEPTVKILSETYINTQVEAGDSVTKQIVIENTGDESVPLSPERAEQRGHCYGTHCPQQVDQSWIDIDAPSQIEPGETATVTVTIAPDADADRGRYDTSVNLGLDDPNRRDDNGYWQEISLNFVVWEQPEEPYEVDFTTDERTDNVTLTLNPRNYRAAENADDPSFDVTFVSPDGERIDAERVEVTERGSVNLGAQRQQGATEDGAYATQHAQTKFVYELDAPDEGEWTAEIMPDNTIGFQYELTKTESDDADE